jgi:hypothetical protein
MRAPRASETYHYATVEPLVESSSAGAEWLGPLEGAMSRFPERGLVHWHDAPLGLKEGSLWQFTIDEHPSARRGRGPERVQLRDPREPIEVLDLRGWEDHAALRSMITGDGIPLSPSPLARRVLLWLSSGVCVGPILLRTGTQGLWVFDKPDGSQDVARVPIYRPSDTDINRVSIDGERWFVSPRLGLGQRAGIENWMSNAQVARSILGRLRKMNPELVKSIGMTDKLFGEYLDHVEGGRMGSADPAVERARADRLRGVRDAIQRDVALLTEATQALLAREEVRIEREVQAKIAEEVRARQTEIDVALASATEHLVQLRKDLDAKRVESAELDTALLAKQRELEAKVTLFEQEVTSRLEEIARRPETFFADTAIIRAALAPILDRRIAGRGAAVHVRSPLRDGLRDGMSAGSGPGEATSELCDIAAVRRALAAYANVGELSIFAMLGLHAALVAGVVPVIAGNHGYDLLRAYASAVAGGRLLWIPVGSSTMEPYDLLGRFDGASGRILPSPSGLLDVVRDAMQSERLHLVVLEGFNRAPTEGYLLPILEAAQAGRSGDLARTIPIASSGLLASDDPYHEMGRLVWPPNVLVACIPSDGSLTLPVPSSVWRFLALLDADDRERAPMPSASQVAAPLDATEIAPVLWKEGIASVRADIKRDTNGIGALARALSLSSRDTADAVRVCEVLTGNGLPSTDATALAAGTILIPRSGAEQKAVDDGLRAAGVSVIGLRTILAEAQRLRI